MTTVSSKKHTRLTEVLELSGESLGFEGAGLQVQVDR